ncbi:MAG: biotin--[acetyl-CoA-carboxylase] ligase, partial [Acutalibacteraceae bacterium]|nr:biotin--[acetyl-CoA-carboxylase] ligase [Acutalibacteraceae bacterium]
ADILAEFNTVYKDFDNTSYVDEYIKRSIVIGKKVDVINAFQTKAATVLGISKDCKLHIKYEDGAQSFLDSGEISVKLL